MHCVQNQTAAASRKDAHPTSQRTVRHPMHRLRGTFAPIQGGKYYAPRLIRKFKQTGRINTPTESHFEAQRKLVCDNGTRSPGRRSETFLQEMGIRNERAPPRHEPTGQRRTGPPQDEYYIFDHHPRRYRLNTNIPDTIIFPTTIIIVIFSIWLILR